MRPTQNLPEGQQSRFSHYLSICFASLLRNHFISYFNTKGILLFKKIFKKKEKAPTDLNTDQRNMIKLNISSNGYEVNLNLREWHNKVTTS